MSRTRLIRPEMATDDDLAVLEPNARLLAAFLPCLADRAGVLEDRPRTIQFKIFPAHPDVDIEALLEQLVTIGHVRRYTGRRLDDPADAPVRLLWLPTFARTQKPHRSEVESTYTLPAPQTPACASDVDALGNPCGLPRSSARTAYNGATAAHSDACSHALGDPLGDPLCNPRSCGDAAAPEIPGPAPKTPGLAREDPGIALEGSGPVHGKPLPEFQGPLTARVLETLGKELVKRGTSLEQVRARFRIKGDYQLAHVNHIAKTYGIVLGARH